MPIMSEIMSDLDYSYMASYIHILTIFSSSLMCIYHYICSITSSTHNPFPLTVTVRSLIRASEAPFCALLPFWAGVGCWYGACLSDQLLVYFILRRHLVCGWTIKVFMFLLPCNHGIWRRGWYGMLLVMKGEWVSRLTQLHCALSQILYRENKPVHRLQYCCFGVVEAWSPINAGSSADRKCEKSTKTLDIHCQFGGFSSVWKFHFAHYVVRLAYSRLATTLWNTSSM